MGFRESPENRVVEKDGEHQVFLFDFPRASLILEANLIKTQIYIQIGSFGADFSPFWASNGDADYYRFVNLLKVRNNYEK